MFSKDFLFKTFLREYARISSIENFLDFLCLNILAMNTYKMIQDARKEWIWFLKDISTHVLLIALQHVYV